MKIMKRLFLVVVLATFVVVIGGCKKEEDKTVKLGSVNWADCIAMTNLAKVVLEDKMGYEVEVTVADAAPIFASISTGDNDAFLDTWLPVTHKNYMDQYGDQVVEVGTNYNGAKIGLVVPTYVTADSIEELNSYKDQFEGKIVGIDAGAGIMGTTETAIEQYGLDFELTTSSGPMMTAALEAAIDNEEWIVVTGWSPHWKFARWDLKYLEDPKGIFGEEEVVKTIGRLGLEADMPEVYEFLENFHLTDQELGDLMGKIANSDDEAEEVARVWMNNHENLVNTWLPESLK